MASTDGRSVIDRAKRIYADQLQAALETRQRNRFVALEPESGDYLLGDTFDEVVKAARAEHPSRLSHPIRIGRFAAFHLGVCGYAGSRVGRYTKSCVPKFPPYSRRPSRCWPLSAVN